MNNLEQFFFNQGYQVHKKNLLKISDIEKQEHSFLQHENQYWEVGCSDSEFIQIWNNREGVKVIPIQEALEQEILQFSTQTGRNIIKNIWVHLKKWTMSHKKLSFNFLLFFIFYEWISLLEPLILDLSLGHLDFFGQAKEWFIPLGVGGSLMMFGMLIDYYRQKYIIIYSGKIALNIAQEIWQKFILQDLIRLVEKSPNEFYTRMYAMEQIFYRLIQQCLNLLNDLLYFLMHISLMFFFSWQISCLELVFMGLIAWVHCFSLSTYFKKSKEVAHQQQFHLTFLLETFHNLLSIKIFKKEWIFWKRWQLKVLPYWHHFLKNDFFQSQVMISLEVLRKINVLMVLFFALYLIAQQQMQVGTFIAFLALKSQVFGRFEGVFKRLMQWQYLKTPIVRIEEVLSENNSSLANKITIHFDLQSLKYMPQKMISKKFLAGHKYLIRGISGCGKTSLLKCMIGVKKPLEGHIEAPEKVVSILQEDRLWSGTIRENITFFTEGEDSHFLQMLIDFVEIQKPLHSTIEYLSQGEQQRVLIARALYARPNWLILDEATCHLDEKAEKNIVKKLLKLPIGLILVSHRPNLYQGFDEIVELN